MSDDDTMTKKASSINYLKIGGLEVSETLYDFVKDEIIPGSEVDNDDFWSALADMVSNLAPRNAELLNIRDELQEKIDQWHLQHHSKKHDPVAYKQFLQEIGYLRTG